MTIMQYYFYTKPVNAPEFLFWIWVTHPTQSGRLHPKLKSSDFLPHRVDTYDPHQTINSTILNGRCFDKDTYIFHYIFIDKDNFPSF